MRKNTVFIGLLVLMAAFISSFNIKVPASSTEDEVDKKVKALLSKMSLEEKAGQMTQIDIRNYLNNGYQNTDQKLDPAKLKEAIQTYKVGSILNCIHAYTPEKWIELITQIQKECLKSPNKIPVVYGTDAVHGVGFIKDAVLFPHNIGLAATRNNQLVKRAGEITALEGRAVGLTWNFAPVLDVGREPYWSRLEETFGEDVYITTQMGVAAIRGMESAGLADKRSMASCMKHFIGYSAPKNGIDRTPAHIPEIVLREYYLPSFREAVNSGAATLMINSGEINGIPTHGNKYLLTDVLRKELGFKGLACSDWEDIIRLHTWHKVAATPKEAVAMAVNAGVDMSMVPNDYSFTKYVIELVNEGKISKERLDEAVGRILKLKFNLGLFDNPLPDKKDLKNFGKPEYQTSALDAARESITLLKNEKNILPLNKSSKILLAGPCADNITTLNSSWSYTWQGDVDTLYPKFVKSIKQEFEVKFGKANVTSKTNKNFNHDDNYDISFIEKNAGSSDVIVLCLGEHAYAEQPGVIRDLNLPENQKKLIQAAAKTGKPVVVVLVQGRPRLFPEEAELSTAVLMAYRPGNQGARAITEVLTGEVNPSGILPITYPKYNGDITTYDHKFKETEQQLVAGQSDFLAFQPQWEFGHGLSYTTFDFANLKVNKNTLSANDSLNVTVDVTNSGKVAGKIAVELYSRDHFASITPSERRLRKYTKIELQPAQKQTVSFTVHARDLQFVNHDLKTVTEPGDFDLMVKGLKTTVSYK